MTDVSPQSDNVLFVRLRGYTCSGKLQTGKKDSRDLHMEVAFVEGEEKIEDLSQRNIQYPRLFYRRELEDPFLISGHLHGH